MAEEFRKILTYIDFSPISLHASREAAMMASKFNSELHLLHASHNNKNNYDNLTFQLQKLKSELGELFGIKIECHEIKGHLSESINNYIHQLNSDLLVLGVEHETWIQKIVGKNKAKSIIKNADTEVLCVYPESNSSRLKKIVLPIGKFIPKRKIRLAYELAKKFAANVHLISLNKNGTNLSREDTKILMASYQYLKDITNIPVECRTVPGNNLAQATVQYAETIGADLILVNSGAESFFKNAVLGRWSGSIVDHSSIPVLSVHAINEKTKHTQYRV